MPNKLANKKSGAKPIEPADAMASQEEPAADGGEVPSSQKDVFNAETAKVLRDADAGKNLLIYPSLEDMFNDLGI
jgi:hypothetical protein